MKKFLFFLATVTFFLPVFSFAQNDNVKTNTINAEFKTNGKTIRINATNRNITIESWNEDKIKIVTGYSSADKENEADKEALLAKAGITVNEMNASMNINVKEGSYSTDYRSNSNYQNISGSFDPLNSKKNISIYLPRTSKISIDLKYGNLTSKKDFDKLDVDITNSNLDLESAKDLKLTSKYGNSTIGEIKTGEIDFMNGNLIFNSVGEIDLDTKYSTVEIANAKKINFSSTNDEYEIDEVGEMAGRKNYGNLRISKLISLIEITGTNADMKIKNIASTVSSIKIDDKYASLRLPIKNLKDYNLDIKGTYNTVYPTDEASVSANSVKSTDGSGKGTVFQIKCTNCTIDLK